MSPWLEDFAIWTAIKIEAKAKLVRDVDVTSGLYLMRIGR